MPIFGYSGYTHSGQFINNIITGGLFTCPEEATPDSIVARLYAWAVGGRAKCAIYDANRNLLCSTEELTVPTANTDLLFNIVGAKPALHANTDYYLVVWGDDSVCVSSAWMPGEEVATFSLAYTGSFPSVISAFTITSNSMVAIYCNYTAGAPAIYNLTLSATEGGSTNPAVGTYSYPSGAIVSVTAILASGYIFSHWLLNGVNVGSVNPFSVTMNADYNLQAVFATAPPPIPVTLTILPAAGGSTTPAPATYTYQSGDTVTITATPGSGYIFSRWVINGVNAGSVNPYSFVITGDTIIEPVFAIAPPSGVTLPLHVEGAQVKDSSGRIIPLRGIVYPHYTASCTGHWYKNGDWFWGTCVYTFEEAGLNQRLDELVSYGFKTIRLCCNYNWVKNNSRTTIIGGTTNIGIRESIMAAIRACAQKGIYVILDIAGTGGNTDTSIPSDFVSFWRTMAQLYGNEPNVIFEPWGETIATYSTWLTRTQEVVAAIREYTNNIILIQYGYCGSFGFVADINPLIAQYGNIVYSNHVYRYPVNATMPQGTTTTAQITANLNAWGYGAVIGRYPVIIGEIGAWLAYGSDETTWWTNILAIFNSWGVGYCAWEWGQLGTGWQLQQDAASAPYPLNTNGTILRNAIAAGAPPPPETVNLTVTASTGGTTNPTPGVYAYALGSSAQVSAIASSGYNFDHWELDGNNVGSANPITVQMNTNHSLHAVFVAIPPPPQYTLTISSVTGGTTTPPAGAYLHDEGSAVQVTAIPDVNYRFVNWNLDGAIRTENPITVLMNQNHTLQAIFEYAPPPPVTHSLTATSAPITEVPLTIDGSNYTTPISLTLQEGAHAIIAPSNIVVGTDIYNFVYWEDGSTSPSRTLNLTADMIVTATYALAPPPPPQKGKLEIHAFLDSQEIVIPYEVT